MTDLTTLTSWHADWKGLRVAVLGLSVTGFSVADTLAELGADVLVVTERADAEYGRLLPVLGVRLHEGPLDAVPAELVDFAPEVVVASPGFPPHHPVIRWTQDRGIALWGDVELAWRVRDKVVRADGRPADWVLITGTNGKTTTTRLTAEMLVTAGLRAAPVGNIGTPSSTRCATPADSTPSSWNCRATSSGTSTCSRGRMPSSRPTPRCASTSPTTTSSGTAGPTSTARPRRASTPARVACVYNKADVATREMVEDAEVVEGARAIGFDLGVPGPSDLGVVDGILVDRAFLEERATSALELTTVADLAERGLAAPHMVANILAGPPWRARSARRRRRSSTRSSASVSTPTASRSWGPIAA